MPTPHPPDFRARLSSTMKTLPAKAWGIVKEGFWKVVEEIKGIADTLVLAYHFIFSPVLTGKNPPGKVVRALTITLLTVCLIGSVAYSLTRFRTTPLQMTFSSSSSGCTDCQNGEWRVDAVRTIAEGTYSYSDDPNCIESRTRWAEAGIEVGKNAVMIALAPTKLFLGSAYDAYDLRLVQALVGNSFKGSWFGRLIGSPDTAECAPLFVIFPTGSVANPDKFTVFGWSTHTQYSTLAEKHDVGQHFGCNVDGTNVECHGDTGSFARLQYKPTPVINDRYTAYRTVFMNWYHDDAWFHSNPREIHMRLYFRPPDSWHPDPQQLNTKMATSLRASEDPAKVLESFSSRD